MHTRKPLGGTPVPGQGTCPVCGQEANLYRPTGTRVLRVGWHDAPGQPGTPCSGVRLPPRN